MKTNLFTLIGLLVIQYGIAQQVQSLDSVTIESTRIDLPFKENSRTISIITAEVIEDSPATNLAELLQQEAGIDIRRQGIYGMQADLYIRGGSFDQTLLLIDGIKVEDPQTGHHTLNIALPLEVIKRIEIIKGPAARIFGQNAFTGAINIVTKTNGDLKNNVGFQLGSYNQQHATATLGKSLDKASVMGHASINSSEGYRYNTDFQNQNYFLKSSFNTKTTPIDVIATFSERKFGGNQFYAIDAKEQYEETQSSLVGISTIIKRGDLKISSQLYWKRNQDMYLYIRNNPSVYRNLHISNKVGIQINSSYSSSFGVTGFGIDVAKVKMNSNRLGNRERWMGNFFLEHRFSLLDNKLDVTPGVAVNYFSEFDFNAFPGIDLGYRINDSFRVYANAGYTYRVPTYNDLYYVGRQDIGNENLVPERAISEEVGLKYFGNKLTASVAFFNRDSDNLIDYTKENEDDKWQSNNLKRLNSNGIEAQLSSPFKLGQYTQSLSLGYTYLNEDLGTVKSNFSKYIINSLNQHLTANIKTQFSKNFSQSVVYKFADRANGENYSVVDVQLKLMINTLELTLTGNNIFNASYIETGIVPMPKGNVLVGLRAFL
ncbi:TonB-dependent receptor [Formosa sp. Hel3_A1_48]|jgi:iron complex outermembrane receptor protein|uniref:TonB-dependent receptor plug domain-containing protein n=1 Tax=Formosa sp. Hel3_A1_48 TaxID=1336795 RepID=UPI00084E2FD8|nr:TonB-dependent receptor [Formosa sp. Hel3_A1_48]AOR26266.1 TonB-dependent receptor [Formosa sp. Hel3_A1_48]MDC0949986.1 TonB-dependent receptor [Flavobacteriaceae bacterium]